MDIKEFLLKNNITLPEEKIKELNVDVIDPLIARKINETSEKYKKDVEVEKSAKSEIEVKFNSLQKDYELANSKLKNFELEAKLNLAKGNNSEPTPAVFSYLGKRD